MRQGRLSQDQKDTLLCFRDEWLEIGRSTGQADIETIRPVIGNWYKRIGVPAPEIVHCSSPFHAVKMIEELNIGRGITSILYDNVGRTFIREILKKKHDTLPHDSWWYVFMRIHEHLAHYLRDGFGYEQRLRHEAKLVDCTIQSYWIAEYLYYHLHVQPFEDDDLVVLLRHWETVAKNAGWIYAFEEIALICDRPVFYRFDASGRLHCLDGPAVQWSDGSSFFMVLRTPVAESLVGNPAMITLEQIQKEYDADMRSALIYLYGKDRFIRDSKAQVVDHDPDVGTLYQVRLWQETPQRLLHVVKPGGRLDDYWLEVNLDEQSPKKADEYAWLDLLGDWPLPL